VVGRFLQRDLRAFRCAGLVASLVGWLGHGQQFLAGGTQCTSVVERHTIWFENLMEILYLLVPLSVVLVFLILGGIWWAIHSGQFEDIDQEGERILKD
jgi:cbb3-type cytochrome oxidase maturation protein